MTKLEQIEKSVTQLDSEELEAFSRWFEEFQAERWDQQIKKDDAEGKFDRLAAEALSEFRAGKTRAL